jgi:hypothetical protein
MKKMIALVISLMLVLTIAGCSAKETPEEVVENGLTAVQSLDLLKMAKYFNTDVDTEDGNIFEEDLGSDNIENIKLLVENLEFEIISSEINEDSAVVEAKLTNTDMSIIMQEYFIQAFTFALSNMGEEDEVDDEKMEAEMEQMFIDLLSKEDNEKITTNVSINLKQVNDKWKIELDDGLLNGIFGGLLAAAEQFDE